MLLILKKGYKKDTALKRQKNTNCNACAKKKNEEADCLTKEEMKIKGIRIWKKRSKFKGASLEVLMTNVELLIHCQDCNYNVKSPEEIIQEDSETNDIGT